MKKVIFLFLSLVGISNALAGDNLFDSHFGDNMTLCEQYPLLKKEIIVLKEEITALREEIKKEKEKQESKQPEDFLIALTQLLASSGEIVKLPSDIKCFSREDPEESDVVEFFLCDNKLYLRDICKPMSKSFEPFFGSELPTFNDILKHPAYAALLIYYNNYCNFKNKATQEDSRISILNKVLSKSRHYMGLHSKINYLEKQYAILVERKEGESSRILIRRLYLVQSIINFIDDSFLSTIEKVAHLRDFQARVKNPFEKGLLEEAINHTYKT